VSFRCRARAPTHASLAADSTTGAAIAEAQCFGAPHELLGQRLPPPPPPQHPPHPPPPPPPPLIRATIAIERRLDRRISCRPLNAQQDRNILIGLRA